VNAAGAVKTEFGNAVSRALRGGVRLLPLEAALLNRLVSALPEHLRTTVERQFARYTLAQREIDGRAVNFYRTTLFGRPTTVGLPLLAMKKVEAPLVRASFRIGRDPELHHAVLTAVNGRAFCLSLDVDARRLGPAQDIRVVGVVQAWRSDFAETR
jgi:hypothetical protein